MVARVSRKKKLWHEIGVDPKVCFQFITRARTNKERVEQAIFQSYKTDGLGKLDRVSLRRRDLL